MHYIYLLTTKNNKSYIGCTSDIKKRLTRHQRGQVPATKDLRPLKLISYIVLKNKYTAFKLEKYFKSGSGRAFIKKHFMCKNN